MAFSHPLTKINLAERVMSLESAWKANPDDPDLDSELSLAGCIFGAHPFKSAAASLEKKSAEQILQIQGIPSDESPFHILTQALKLPKSITNSLEKIYQEFQSTFVLPDGAKENDTDYRYCIGTGICLPAVQIDMAALSDLEISNFKQLSSQEQHDFLINHIFEIEGSIAAYGMLSNLFNSDDMLSASSRWGKGWRHLLDTFREKYQRPIVLLATTQEKYESMLGYEFGLSQDVIALGKKPIIEEIKLISGFDDFWGPKDYLQYLENSTETDDFDFPKNHPLLYVRASSPANKLRDPESFVAQPLLDSAKIRRIIRAFSLTANIDNPAAPFSQHVNDTKAYMPAMNLGFEVNPDDENVKLWMSNQTNSNGSGSLKFMGKNKDNPFIADLRKFLESRDINPEGDFYLRAKPLVDVFGGYGHLKLKFQNGRPGKMSILEREMQQRGPYILQPELISNSRIDAAGTAHREIWRIFFATNAVNKEIFPIGGLVNSIPATSMEVRGKVERVHGNVGATFREIILDLFHN